MKTNRILRTYNEAFFFLFLSFLPSFLSYQNINKYQIYKDEQDKVSLSFIQASLDHELPPPTLCLSNSTHLFKVQFKPHLLKEVSRNTHKYLSDH